MAPDEPVPALIAPPPVVLEVCCFDRPPPDPLALQLLSEARGKLLRFARLHALRDEDGCAER